jgi:geranylgeranyl reductase family protein
MRNSAVIVGAGPGGAAAAVRLAEQGVRDVVLVDKDDFPREKTCGSALSPNGLIVADALGIGAEVRRLGYPIHSLRLVTAGDRELQLSTGAGSSVVLLRKHFDNLLVERARALGVTFRGGFRVASLLRHGDRVVGVRGKDGEELRADFVLAADGAHSIFSSDPRPKRTISTLMGWWEGMPIVPGTMEMIFDRSLSPLYGWMFPENDVRVNIGICMDGEDAGGAKTERNVRQVFAAFLAKHYGARLAGARQIGKLKGHPISYTTWIQRCTGPGVLWLGEAARLTHNATGEGIYQAMQSGIYAADAIAQVVHGDKAEERAWRDYRWQLRKKFTVGFAAGHLLRGVLKTPLLEAVAAAYNSPVVRKAAFWGLSRALAGSRLHEEERPPASAVTRVPPAASEVGRGAGRDVLLN